MEGCGTFQGIKRSLIRKLCGGQEHEKHGISQIIDSFSDLTNETTPYGNSALLGSHHSFKNFKDLDVPCIVLVIGMV